jgi:hypothetical protein
VIYLINEIAGSGNSYTAEYWQYDSRLGRRWNVDPITYPWQSSYAAFNNNPIYFTDPLGLEGDPPAVGNCLCSTVDASGQAFTEMGSGFDPAEGVMFTASSSMEFEVIGYAPLQTNTITNAMDNVRVDINRFIQDAVINEINNQINDPTFDDKLIGDERNTKQKSGLNITDDSGVSNPNRPKSDERGSEDVEWNWSLPVLFKINNYKPLIKMQQGDTGIIKYEYRGGVFEKPPQPRVSSPVALMVKHLA